MAASTVHCHVLGGDVTVVTDLSGNVTNIVCPEFNRLTYTCHRKKDDQGFFANIASRVADRLAGTRANYCEFADPNTSPTTRFVGPPD